MNAAADEAEPARCECGWCFPQISLTGFAPAWDSGDVKITRMPDRLAVSLDLVCPCCGAAFEQTIRMFKKPDVVPS